MKRTLLFFGILLAAGTVHAQDILKKYGCNKEILTLSKGRYKETFVNENVMQIGTVLIDTRTEKVVKFLEEDTTEVNYKADNTSRFMTIDPVAEKYPELSPYVYCRNNPVRYIDPDGRDVKPAGVVELKMIQNTLPKEARDYVRLDKSGIIDKNLLNAYSGKSLNFNNLKTMVNSDKTVEIRLNDQFTFARQNGKLGIAKMAYFPFNPQYDSESDKDLTGETIGGLSTGESGFMGKTLFPDREGIQNSPNGNIIVIVNKHLSAAGAAEIYSHEANGHALLYIMNGGDHKGASHQPVNGTWIEGNKTLQEMIINSKKETIKNMKEQ
ncbi:MAG: hypothetical protein FWF52_03775 [Candidatus Azobacteroides sp.]|nr:hypothetical protein [Candidatus Azobacteroides sp.]